MRFWCHLKSYLDLSTSSLLDVQERNLSSTIFITFPPVSFYRLTLHLQNSVWMTITQCITTTTLVWFSREFCLLWLSSNSTTRFIMLSKYDGKIWEVINGSSSMVKFKDFSWIGNKTKLISKGEMKSNYLELECNLEYVIPTTWHLLPREVSFYATK